MLPRLTWLPKLWSFCSARMMTSGAGQTNTQTTTTANKLKEIFLRKPSSKHETSSNPIRCAREYSVPKTACLAAFRRVPFECDLRWRRKPRDPAAFAPEPPSSIKFREPSGCRVSTRGHRGRRGEKSWSQFRAGGTYGSDQKATCVRTSVRVRRRCATARKYSEATGIFV